MGGEGTMETEGPGFRDLEKYGVSGRRRCSYVERLEDDVLRLYCSRGRRMK